MFRKSFASLACAALALTGGLSLASHDLLGQGIFGLSEEQELELGKQAAAEIEKEEPILQDATVTRYIDALGQALVRTSQRSNIPYTFKVVDSEAVNAFALPGGYIYVNRGLIEAASNESELAGVLAHEVSHVVARHSAEQVKKLQITGLGLGILGAILGDGKAAQIGNVASQLVATGVFLKYSREAEREADRLGAQNLYDTGYDPRAMVTFFEKLADMRQREPNKFETFFSSHPDPRERAENVKDLISSFPYRSDLRVDSRSFQAIQRHLGSLPPPVKRVDSDTAPTTPGAPAPDETAPVQRATYRGEEQDRAVAARFAPVFRVGVTANPRYDLPVKFDFDGDWRADNNAANVESSNFRPASYVYYALSETSDHYFIHYGLYFPVENEGADQRSQPRDNDMEFCLVVVEKESTDPRDRPARVAALETFVDGQVRRFIPNASLLGGFGSVSVEDGRPVLFVHPDGHRMSPYRGDESRSDYNIRGEALLRYTGRAEDPFSTRGDSGYDLTPLYPLWAEARNPQAQVYGAGQNFGRFSVEAVGYRNRTQTRTVDLGNIGTTFRSDWRHQSSTAPWAWSEEGQRPGEWFLDPAGSLRRHFNLSQEFVATYVHHPFLGVERGSF